MKKIIEELEVWAENIAYDIKMGMDNQQQINVSQMQRIELLQAIGILKGLGHNPNIPQ